MLLVVFNPQERAALEQVAAHEPLTSAARRAQALLWLAAGESIVDVAVRLGVSRQTVYNWVTSFRLRRHDADVRMSLHDKPRSGRPPRRAHISALPTPLAIDRLLAAIIDRDPRECGYHAILWTPKLLRQYLNEVHNLRVTAASVRSALTRLENGMLPVKAIDADHAHNQVA